MFLFSLLAMGYAVIGSRRVGSHDAVVVVVAAFAGKEIVVFDELEGHQAESMSFRAGSKPYRSACTYCRSSRYAGRATGMPAVLV